MTESPSAAKTHYDVLRVATDVSAEDLRAAYRTLSARYHPDRHPNHADAAARLMASINVAYDVLSDPERRANYDREIGVRPLRAPGVRLSHAARYRYLHPAARAGEPAAAHATGEEALLALSMRRRERAARRLMGLSAFCCMVGVLLLVSVLVAPAEKEEDRSDLARALDARGQRAVGASGPPDIRVAAAVPERLPAGVTGPVHIRPLESPLGLPWPSVSGELPGYGRGFATGELGLLLDNRIGPSDVFVKVYGADGDGLVPARHVLVRARDRLLLDAFPPGEYEVHYLSLDTGQTLRSVPLLLTPAAQALAPQEYRLDDMQGRSGRAMPIARAVFDSPAPGLARQSVVKPLPRPPVSTP
ncbi:MAG: J domain-containing protein [Burkholderiales bacterium]|nr:J domain-containing protein [Burkholderiales bacterium]